MRRTDFVNKGPTEVPDWRIYLCESSRLSYSIKKGERHSEVDNRRACGMQQAEWGPTDGCSIECWTSSAPVADAADDDDRGVAFMCGVMVLELSLTFGSSSSKQCFAWQPMRLNSKKLPARRGQLEEGEMRMMPKYCSSRHQGVPDPCLEHIRPDTARPYICSG